MSQSEGHRGSFVDFASVGGLLVAGGGILSGMLLEGGNVLQLSQPSAFLIVVGGTMGAVMVQFPLQVFLASVKQMWRVFRGKAEDNEAAIEQLVRFTGIARRGGIISLDNELGNVADPFLKMALTLAVDGTAPAEVRSIMQLEMDNRAEAKEKVAHVLEAAGGFAPTVGIIGAVLGLIQVMQHLDKIQEVGKGIAVAFVSTLYGVGLANLICLPSAGKLKIRNQEDHLREEMMLEGVVSILEGMNPRMLEIKLRTFVTGTKKGSKTETKKR